jgi:hypothetical protein
MRVLVVNPITLRYHQLGACEQDRMIHLHDLRRYGHEVIVLTQCGGYQTQAEVEDYYRQQDFPATIVSPPPRWSQRRLSDPAFLDGASWDYGHDQMIRELKRLLREFQPDRVWCHASFVWAPAAVAHRMGFKTVIRSVNYEPHQLWYENGRSAANLVRYLGKVWAERRTLQYASVCAAITPHEQQIYQRINPKARVELLPLRGLSSVIAQAPRHPSNRTPLRVFMMGATYNVLHNLAALRFVVDEILPRARSTAPGAFEFHILGSKVPPAIQALAANDLVFDGFVPDLTAHLDTMDIALVPSLSGAGMQQKVFESLARGFPTLTHQRVLAGYPFENQIHVLTANSADEFVEQLQRLRDPDLRASLSSQVIQRSQALFGRDRMDQYLQACLGQAE